MHWPDRTPATLLGAPASLGGGVLALHASPPPIVLAASWLVVCPGSGPGPRVPVTATVPPIWLPASWSWSRLPTRLTEPSTGRVLASWSGPAGDPVEAELVPGQVIGGEVLLLTAPPAVAIRSIRDSLLLRLGAPALDRLAAGHPEVVPPLFRALAGYLLAPASVPVADIARRPRTVAVLAAGQPAMQAEFVGRLVNVLGRFGPVLRVNSEVVDGQLGVGFAELSLHDPRNGRLVEWLQRVEREHTYLVFEAAADTSAWTTRCLRQADRVLVVVDGDAVPVAGRGPLLPSGLDTMAPVEAVLLHDDATVRPRGAAGWLVDGRTVAHHHLRRGRTGDYERLARHLSGRSVGLVLGGGGARGFVHLGVMQALEEAGVPVDAIGGTSIGAIMAAFYALGWDHGTRVKAAKAAFIDTRFLIGYTLPLVALSSTRTLTGLLRSPAFFDQIQIEDLWLPWLCVSANLSTAQAVVHDRGDVWRAVRASISLPGIMPPVYDEGDLLVDGGIINNLPADVMQDRIGGGRVIAVDLQQSAEFRSVQPFEPTLSGWQVLAGKLRRGQPSTVPGIVSVLLRMTDVASSRVRQELLSSDVIGLHLQPPMAKMPLLDFSAGPQLVELGYRYALGQLDEETVRALTA